MQAVVVTPGVGGSTRVEEIEPPVAAPGEVLVRVLEVGVCGTDREIDHGLFGIAPEGEERLVIGHELLGVVERDGGGFERGKLVAATVRRSCGDCLACLRRSGVACLIGIDGREQRVSLDGRVLALQTILENHVLFGSVNARREDWLAGVEALDRALARWPDALDSFVKLRVPLDRFAEAFAERAGKATLVVSD